MSEKRRLSVDSFEKVMKVKKLKIDRMEKPVLSPFELLPDDILIIICEKLSNKDVRRLFRVSRT